MICCICRFKHAEAGHDECFRCRVSTVGFSFRGGGGYTRESFHEQTIGEKRREILGDKVVGVDVVPSSEFGR